MTVEPGTLDDWKKLCVFHYRSHNTSARRAVFAIRRKDELCAVIVYCYPFPQCAGRRQVLPKMSMTRAQSEAMQYQPNCSAPKISNDRSWGEINP